MSHYKTFPECVQSEREDMLAGLCMFIEEWAERQIKHGYELTLYEFLAVHPEWDKQGLHDFISKEIDRIKHSFGD